MDVIDTIFNDNGKSNFVLEHKISFDWTSVIKTAIAVFAVSALLKLIK